MLRLEKPLKGTRKRLIQQQSSDLGDVSRSFCYARQDLTLKAPIALPEVMKEGEEAQTRHLHLVEVVEPARPREPAADGRLAEQRLEHAGDVGAMVD